MASLCCQVSSCGKEGGCVEQQRPCLLQLMKENWEELGIALKSDKYILQLMKETKQKFDRMKKNGNLIEASSLRKTTFNLAAVDWRDKVNQDRRLRADWRREKLAFIEVLHKIHLICFDVSGRQLFGICLKLFIFH